MFYKIHSLDIIYLLQTYSGKKFTLKRNLLQNAQQIVVIWMSQALPGEVESFHPSPVRLLFK